MTYQLIYVDPPWQYGDVSRVELFARESWPGWDRRGNQCSNSFEIIPGHINKNEVAE